MTEKMFFDTDCLSAFLWVEQTEILGGLYNGRIVIPDPVYQELSLPSIPHLKKRADQMIDIGHASIQEICVGTEEYALYYELVHGTDAGKSIGQGEAACIALAKTFSGILASNNLRDIKPYIVKYDLQYITTADIMMEAFNAEIISEEEGNDIWSRMLNKKRLLPTSTFSDYLAGNG